MLPPHGRRYYVSANDNHPSGDPDGVEIEDVIQEFRKANVQYYFGKINSSTDKMVSVFSKALGEPIEPFSLKDVGIPDSVTCAVSRAVESSVAASTAPKGRKLRPFVLNPTVPEWDSLDTIRAKILRYELPPSLESYIVHRVPLERTVKACSLKVAASPFDKGGERIAFHGMDVTHPEHPVRVVLKETMFVGDGMNKAQKYEAAIEGQSIAAYLANKLKKEHPESISLKFLLGKVAVLPLPGGKSRFMAVERLFHDCSKFVKFTNNAAYTISKQKMADLGMDPALPEYVMAFSHYTFAATQGKMMVVDLQGVIATDSDTSESSTPHSGSKPDGPKLLLTDPAIHDVDLTRFYPMNHGLKGMQLFFANHECNQFCKKWGIEGKRL